MNPFKQARLALPTTLLTLLLSVSLAGCSKSQPESKSDFDEKFPDLTQHVGTATPGATPAKPPSAATNQAGTTPTEAPAHSGTLAPALPEPAVVIAAQAPQTAPQIVPEPSQAPPLAPVTSPGTTGNQASAAPTTTSSAEKPKRFTKANNVAGEYSRYMLGQGRYFESIVAQLEGFRAHPYRDNIGVAIGWGFNASHQTQATNRKAGIEVLGSPQAAAALMSLTGQMSPPVLPAIAVTPEQGMAMSLMLKPQYEDPMRAWIPGFDQLKEHQKSVLVYHAYKTGGAGAAKYTTLKAKIAVMLANPTPENTRDAGSHFQYTYLLGKERKTDTRSTVYMQALWNDPQAYADLIGGKASSFVATLPEFKNTGKAALADDDIPDPMGDIKYEMERTGKPYKVQIKRELSAADLSSIRSRAVAMGGMF